MSDLPTNQAASVINLHTPLKQKCDVVSADVGEEVMLLGIEQGAYSDLKQSGGAIWSLLAETCSVRTICASLMQEYRVEQSLCEAETLAFVQHLLAEGLIEIVPAETSVTESSDIEK